MKVAIPSNDAIHITKDLGSSKGFVVFTIQFGEIIEEEFLQPAINEQETEKGILGTLKDCSLLILPEPDRKNGEGLQSNEIKTVYTSEKIVTKIIWSFLTGLQRQEANTCCCP